MSALTLGLTALCQYVGAFVIGLFALGFALAGLAMMWGRSKLRRDVLRAQRHEALERAMLDGFASGFADGFNNPRRSFVRPLGYVAIPSPVAFTIHGHDEADAAARLCGRTVER